VAGFLRIIDTCPPGVLVDFRDGLQAETANLIIIEAPQNERNYPRLAP
jgi:hypothetical protein